MLAEAIHLPGVEVHMQRHRYLLTVASACVTIGVSGCAHRTYYVAPPPPPPPQAYREVPPLIQSAEQNGFRLGQEEGARDAYRSGYHPRNDRGFRDTPGYDPRLGPFPPYRDAFRSAYLRGYDRNFNH